jgi:cytoskeletal protein RodZ
MKLKRKSQYAILLVVVAGLLATFWVFHSKDQSLPTASKVSVATAPAKQNQQAAGAPSSTQTANSVATVSKPSPTKNSSGSNSQPVSIVAGQQVEYPGLFATASVSVNGKDYQLTPNQLGSFPRVLVEPSSTTHVKIAYPQAHAGDSVVVETEDGGQLDNSKMANIATLDDKLTLQFNFQTTSQSGIYHVTLRNGADVKVLNFWAGAEPLVRE